MQNSFEQKKIDLARRIQKKREQFHSLEDVKKAPAIWKKAREAQKGITRQSLQDYIKTLAR